MNVKVTTIRINKCSLDENPARMKVKQTTGPQEAAGQTEERSRGLDAVISNLVLVIKGKFRMLHKYFIMLFFQRLYHVDRTDI